MKKNILILLISTILVSCNSNELITKNTNSFSENNISSIKKESKYTITGKASFSKEEVFKVKNNLSKISKYATVTILKTHDDPIEPNKSVASGLTNENGEFKIVPNINFSPEKDDIFLLEAKKRIGLSEKANITVLTYIQWLGDKWVSISKNSININKETTALVIKSNFQSEIKPIDTIEKITENNLFDDKTNELIKLIDFMLENNYDPISQINYKDKSYLIKRIETNIEKIKKGKDCQSCDFSDQSLKGKDFSNSDLSGTNFSNSDLEGSDFSNSYLSGANFTNTNLYNSNFTGAKIDNTNFEEANLYNANWLDGEKCEQLSLSKCSKDKLQNNLNDFNNPSTYILGNGNYITAWNDEEDNIFRARIYNSDNTVKVDDIKLEKDYCKIIGSKSNDFYLNCYGSIYKISENGNISDELFQVGENKYHIVIMNKKGQFIIHYSIEDRDYTIENYGSNKRLYINIVQKFDNKFNKIGKEIYLRPSIINDYGVDTYLVSSFREDGSFIVTFQKKINSSTIKYEYYFELYDSNGIKVIDETLINQNKTNYEILSSHHNEKGEFIIFYNNDQKELLTQRFNANGTKKGDLLNLSKGSDPLFYINKVKIDNEGNILNLGTKRETENNIQKYSIFLKVYDNNNNIIFENKKINDLDFYFPNIENNNFHINENKETIVGWEKYNELFFVKKIKMDY